MGETPLRLYLAFVGDLVRSQVTRGAVGSGLPTGSGASAPQQLEEEDQRILWTSGDTRHLLLLRALHGAQEAADAEQATPEAQDCPWLGDLIKV